MRAPLSHAAAVVRAVHPAQGWYASHHLWLQGWLLRKLGCPHHAADLAQDTFVRVLSARRVSDLAEVAEPRAFLTTLARRVLFSHWRRRELEQAYLRALATWPEATAPSAEDMAFLREALAAIDALLNGLPPKVRQAFLLHRLEDRTHVQIAQTLGVSVATVERYMVRAYLHCCRADQADPSFTGNHPHAQPG